MRLFFALQPPDAQRLEMARCVEELSVDLHARSQLPGAAPHEKPRSVPPGGGFCWICRHPQLECGSVHLPAFTVIFSGAEAAPFFTGHLGFVDQIDELEHIFIES